LHLCIITMVVLGLDAKVRPWTNPGLEKPTLQGTGRLFISKDSFIALTGGLGDPCHCIIERLDEGEQPLRCEASVSTQPGGGNLSPNIVTMSRAFQEASGFRIGNQVRITLSGQKMPDAGVVAVQEEVGTDPVEPDPAMMYPPVWETPISLALSRAQLIYPGMVLKGVTVGGSLRRTFKVVSVNSKTSSMAVSVLASTKVAILKEGEAPSVDNTTTYDGELKITAPGLSEEVKRMNKFLSAFTRQFHLRNQRRSCCLVIHGGRGTGKTFLLERLAATNWGRPFWIKPSSKQAVSSIREIFKQAATQQPSMILIDGFQDIIHKDQPKRDAIIDCIADELDILSNMAMEGKSLPRVVVVVTCRDYLIDIPERLQSVRNLASKLMLPIPRDTQRLEMLEYLAPPIEDDEDKSCLWEVAQKTHAFSPRDLDQLVANALEFAGDRMYEAGIPPSDTWSLPTKADIFWALENTRPTAMHDVNLKPPRIRWSDIGGQAHLKKALSRMIKLTTDKNPARLRVMPNAPTSLLLYGPPGCSKTLSAQAMATESGFNFFAVKGAELLNMYVGESERAIRTLFERARAAAPSIIFFDEIDSIGGQRGGPGGSSGSRSTGSVHMLTTVLTEMDGFETLKGVLILAATNCPQAIDPALLRPGRFDQIVFVGLPGQTEREAVLNIHLRGLNLAEDVDISKLAVETEGYSGAEIQAICRAAGGFALDRAEDEEAAEPQHDTEPQHAVEPQICYEDISRSIQKAPRNITSFMIKGYEDWAKSFKKD
jgi:AAA family ATPase